MSILFHSPGFQALARLLAAALVQLLRTRTGNNFPRKHALNTLQYHISTSYEQRSHEGPTKSDTDLATSLESSLWHEPLNRIMARPGCAAPATDRQAIPVPSSKCNEDCDYRASPDEKWLPRMPVEGRCTPASPTSQFRRFASPTACMSCPAQPTPSPSGGPM